MTGLQLTGDRNQCQGCKAYFTTTRGFDRHRTGRFGVDRRCRTSDEMLARGMYLHADGFWRLAKMTESALARLKR